MRVLVIPEKAATPKIHEYKFQKNCRLEVGHSDGRMQPYHALAARASFRDSQFISKINGKRFCLSGPLGLVGLACGMVAAPQIVANRRCQTIACSMRHDLERTKTTSNFCLTTT